MNPHYPIVDHVILIVWCVMVIVFAAAIHFGKDPPPPDDKTPLPDDE